MSINYNDSSTIFGPLNPGVVKQLKRRKEIVSRRTQRSSDDILYLNSNTAWIRVTSAVDLQDGTGAHSARKYQLFGGINSATNGFTPQTDSENSSYSEQDEYGFIPVPGITSFQVGSYGTYGVLRGASFNFSVHSPDDFSKLEQLYLRPGYTVLLEWGHSVKVDNETGVVDSEVSYYPIDEFLKPQKPGTILTKLEELRKVNSHNYDGLYGYIKNFSWTYNGINYECQVDVISQGELVGSIRNLIPGLNNGTDKTEDPTNNASTFSTDIEKVLNKIKTAPVEKFYEEYGIFKSPVENLVLEEVRKATPKYYDTLRDINLIVGSLGGDSQKRTGSWTKYISLRDFLKLINQSGLLYSNDGKPLFEFYTGGDVVNTFLTFSNHFGLDPSICILPKSTKGLELYIPFSDQKANLDPNDILNIFVSVDTILDVYRQLKEAENQADNTVFNLIDKVLKKIQLNLGEINEFISYYDENEGKHYIVDVKVTPGSEDFRKGDDGLPQSYIDLVGLGSEITQMNVQSSISSKITTTVAIAASSNPDPTTTADILNINKWNRGLTDRHNTKTTQSPQLSENAEEIVNRELLDQLKNFLTQISYDNRYYISYSRESFLGYKEKHSTLMNQYVQEAHKQKEDYPGLIPFDLSFTTKGISGLKILQAFKINEFFLPDKYKGRVYFTLFGLDHKVENGVWLMDVKAKIKIV